MSAQKTLSQLSFAAIALLIAAIPCFAQTNSARTEQAGSPSLSSSNQVAVVNHLRRSTAYSRESVVVAEGKHNPKQFSATKFMQALNATESAMTKSSSPTPTIVDNTLDSCDIDLDKPEAPSNITFVPSKGQRIPR